MKLSQLLLSVLAAALFSSPASAALLTGVSGSNTVTNYSGAALVSFDLDLKDFTSTTLNFIVEQDDLLASTLSLNALVRNLSGAGINNFRFSSQGISFLAAGSVTPAFGTLGSVSMDAGGATIDFATPEFAEFQFGNPLALAGASDWILDMSNLRAGDTFSITAAVPEPGTMGLMLAGLALVGARRRQRR